MAAINQTVEYDFPGDKLTGRATATVTGKRILKLSAASGTDGHRKVAHAGAGENAHFLARHDAASGADVSMVRKGCFTVTAGAAITAPTALKVGTAGKVIPATTGSIVVGYALSDAAADGDDVVVDLDLPGKLVI